MPQPLIPLRQHILARLATGESRLLSLVVAVRRALGRDEHVKGNLSDAVKHALQSLISSATVKETDGMYSLTSTNSPTAFRRDTANPPTSKPIAGEE